MDTEGKCPWILNECDDRTQRGNNICEIVKRHAGICDNGPLDILGGGSNRVCCRSEERERADRKPRSKRNRSKSRALDTFWYRRQESNFDENEGCS